MNDKIASKALGQSSQPTIYKGMGQSSAPTTS